MRRLLLFASLLAVVAIVFILSCRHKSTPVATPSTGNYPDSVSSIIISKCMGSACHSSASPGNQNFQMDTWAHMFNGGADGSQVIAYGAKYSPLLYQINVDSIFGPVVTKAEDSIHSSLVTVAQFHTLENWMNNGAPDINGNIPFASNPDTRQKIYLTNQGCNLVAVIDAQSMQTMRFIPVGDPADVTPHDIKVSNDGMYAYVSLYNGNYVQKIDTRTDAIVSTTNLSALTLAGSLGGWSIIDISPGDTALIVSAYLQNAFATINTSSMEINRRMSLASTGSTAPFNYPHGITSNPAFDTFFTCLQYGNEVVKFGFSPHFWYEAISVNGQPPVITNGSDSVNPNPHYIIMSPDYSKYFVTCQQTGRVSVIDAHTDALIAQIPVGFFPQEMAICPQKNYLFVACMQDPDNPNPGACGSVYVIDYNTLNVVAKIYGPNFSSPHDIAVDNQDGLFFIANRNTGGCNINIPPPHHTTVCGGNPGWYVVYNVNTLQPVNTIGYNLTPDAYGIAVRFK